MAPSEYRTIGIVAKPHADNLAAVLARVVALLRRHPVEIILDDGSAHLLQDGCRLASREELARTSDLIIVLGGDGTMLSLARFQENEEKPVLGINMGSLGFLTETSVHDAETAIEAALAGRLQRSRRMMLGAELLRGGERRPLQHVLNDVVINKSALARIFDVDIAIDGERITTIRADGIIVSTPTGSTAYNLAANGPIVHPHMSVILLTPICPHTLTYRPVVLAGEAVIELSMRDSEQTYLTLDGQEGFPLERGDVVRVFRSPRSMTLLMPARNSFFTVLRNKLKWGDR